MTSTTIFLNRQPRLAPHSACDSDRVLDLSLEHGPLAPSTARHEARPVLAAWGLEEEQIYDTLVVISELVTNAVTYALPPVVLHLCVAAHDTGQIEIAISDGGPQSGPENWAATRPADERGRGTVIISALSDDADPSLDADSLIDQWADLDVA
ncbi:ATP-binding protein [Streptomyces sp. NPDC004787]|uniref:ATP-binding protein n=1 Tax=Streptomyces sp. NPDC004787 TaxID=3154291 RepID=UPI0033BCEB0E